MSLFRRVVGGLGDVAKKAAPFAVFIPGVGPVAAAGLGAIGATAGTLNDRKEDGGYKAFNFRNVAPTALGHGAGAYFGAKGLSGLRGGAQAAQGVQGAQVAARGAPGPAPNIFQGARLGFNGANSVGGSATPGLTSFGFEGAKAMGPSGLGFSGGAANLGRTGASLLGPGMSAPAALSSPGGGGSLMDQAISWGKSNPMDVARIGLGALQAGGDAYSQHQQDKLEREIWEWKQRQAEMDRQTDEERYATDLTRRNKYDGVRDEAREAVIAALSGYNPQRPDLRDNFRDPGNPYARHR